MFLNVIKQFNWVDIFVIIILIRIVYIAIKNGLVKEFFKISGTILAIYLSLHYYTPLSDFIRSRFGLKNIPLEFLDFICFAVLAILGYAIFIVIREAFSRLINIEAVPKLNKWGGFILGIARVVLLSGLIAFALVISSVNYLKSSVIGSYSGKSMFKVASTAYVIIWNKLMSKFMSKEKFNQTILEVQKGLAAK